MAFREKLLASWEQPNLLSLVLWPLSQLYRFLFWLRGIAYQYNVFKSYRAPVPVIVVGNITVGGTGKTPLVIYLVELLRAQGFKPGVISRGYAGTSAGQPLSVSKSTAASESGDEPALIVKRCNVPMVVAAKRSLTIKKLLSENEIDIVISDDGLQHLALQRDIEICIEDSTKHSHNDFLLPAGPYRESRHRLNDVDILVQHVDDPSVIDCQPVFAMRLSPGLPKPVQANQGKEWDNSKRTHAVAGIGNPTRFFNTCRLLGMDIIEHAYPDHHQFSLEDIQFDDDLPVLMTEKDAVKCLHIANHQHWYLPVDAKLDNDFDQRLLDKLGELKRG